MPALTVLAGLVRKVETEGQMNTERGHFAGHPGPNGRARTLDDLFPLGVLNESDQAIVNALFQPLPTFREPAPEMSEARELRSRQRISEESIALARSTPLTRRIAALTSVGLLLLASGLIALAAFPDVPGAIGTTLEVFRTNFAQVSPSPTSIDADLAFPMAFVE
jgi:hypothetical protein